MASLEDFNREMGQTRTPLAIQRIFNFCKEAMPGFGPQTPWETVVKWLASAEARKQGGVPARIRDADLLEFIGGDEVWD